MSHVIKGDAYIMEMRGGQPSRRGQSEGSFNAAAEVEELAGRVSRLGPELIFEAGCGAGFATRLLARIPEAWSIVAAESSVELLAEAHQALKAERELPGGVRLLHGDALEKLKEEQGLDLVFASQGLPGLDARSFFGAAYEALAPGGSLAFAASKAEAGSEGGQLLSRLEDAGFEWIEIMEGRQGRVSCLARRPRGSLFR